MSGAAQRMDRRAYLPRQKAWGGLDRLGFLVGRRRYAGGYTANALTCRL